MQLSSLPSYIFSPSADDISIAAEGDVVVSTTLTGNANKVVFDNTSTYSPGADGCVHITELSELVNAAVLSAFDPGTLLKAGVRDMSCTLKIAVKDGASATTHAAYMWRDHTDTGFMFATQMRRRSVLPGQPQPVSVLMLSRIGKYKPGATGLRIVAGAAYRTVADGNVVWKEKTVEGFDGMDYYTILADVDSVNNEIVVAPEGATLLYYMLTLYDGEGKQRDCIRFDVDRRTRSERATHFVYLNMFGVPECVSFTGKDEEKQELESDFGYAGREYVRLDSQLVESHKCHSGWLSQEKRRAVYDLMSSPYAAVYEDGVLRRIAITEVESAVSRPAYEPQSVRLTWRYADDREMRQPHVQPDTGSVHVFARPPFDKTFG